MMEPTMSEQELRKLAEEAVKQKRSFYQNLVVYGVVNAFLVLIWWMSGGGYPWFLWVMGGWGIGLVLHGVTTFVTPERGARHERAVAAEMEKMRR